MMSTLAELRCEAWDALNAAPVRRYMLGRRRCDELVRLAMDNLCEGDLILAGVGTQAQSRLRQGVERRVRRHYSEKCGFTFTTFILSWAVSAIIQVLVLRWWSNQDRK